MDDRGAAVPATGNRKGRWHFDEFSFDPGSGGLSTPDGETRLRHQTALTLEILLENAGEVVSREELRQRVWPDRRVVDFDMGIAGCVREIRAALRESARQPRYLETLRGRGFRFISDVRFEPRHGVAADTQASTRAGTAASTTASTKASPTGQGEAGPMHTGRTARWSIAAAGIGAVLVLAWLFTGVFTEDAQTVEERTPAGDATAVAEPGARLATYMAVDETTSASTRTLSAVFRDELQSLVTQATEGRLDMLAPGVIAAGVADGAAPEIFARDHGAGLFLQGTPAGDRLSVELKDLAEGRVLWRAELDFRDLNTARAAAARAAVEIAAAAFGVTASQPDLTAISPEAESAYLRARLIHEQAGYSAAQMDEAAALYERVLAIEPDFAAAWEGLAEARLWGSGTVEPQISAGRQAAERALELDPDRAEAHRLLGIAHVFGDRSWEAARRELRQAWHLAPFDHRAQRTYGLFLITRGQISEGLGLVEAARVRDPTSDFTLDAAMQAYYYARQFERAAALAEAASARQPTLIRFRTRLFATLFADDVARARTVILEHGARFLTEPGDYASPPARVAVRRYMEDFVAQRLVLLERGAALPTAIASFQVALGRHEEALDLLQATLDPEVYHADMPYLAVAPHLDPLAEHPRFRELLRALDLPPPRGLSVPRVRFRLSPGP